MAKHDHSHSQADPVDVQHTRGHFASRIGFILAAVGSAVGLGNIWKFPYIMGDNGGAAFLLVYLLCILLLGLPVLLVEFVLGRAGKTSPVGVFRKLSRGSFPWWLNGVLGIFTGFLILSFYSTVAGWVLYYCVHGVTVGFDAFATDVETAGSFFETWISGGVEPVMCQLIVMVLTGAIILFGIEKGIERAAKLLMPLLFVMLLILLVRALMLDGAVEGLIFMFRPDFGRLSWEAVLDALGHSFFTLSVGMGAMITYASYVDDDVHLGRTGLLVAGLDTMVALLAGMVIFPIVFAFGLEPGQGAGLLFITLPEVFARMPLGNLLGAMFFFLVFIAALTSAISILEPAVTWLVDDLNLNRHVATLIACAAVFVVGVPATLSVTGASPLSWIQIPFPGGAVGVFDFFDKTTSIFLLPLGGLISTIFLVFAWDRARALKEVAGTGGDESHWLIRLWYGVVTVVAPVGIVTILVFGVIGLFP